MYVVNVVGLLQNQEVSKNISIYYTLEFYLMNAVSVVSVLNENAILGNIYRFMKKSECCSFTSISLASRFNTTRGKKHI
jgi:hypothetical protein